jgi:hypothetical protein
MTGQKTLEGLDQFGNPITQTAPGAGGLGGLGKAATGFLALTQNKGLISDQEALRDKMFGDATSARNRVLNNPYAMSDANMQLRNLGMRPTDTSYLAGTTATGIDALSSDPRMLGGNVQGLLNTQNQGMLAAQQADLKNEIAAETAYAAKEQTYADKNRATEQGFDYNDYARGLAGGDTATQNIANLEQGQRDAWGNIIGGGLDIASSLVFAEEGGKVKYNEGGQIPEELLQQIMAENQGREEQPMEEEQPVVQRTEGEFDHDTNKKAIVDEETGEKEGEATGGEYILNPEQGDAIKSQYETIVQMIDNGDEPTLEELQNLFDAVHEVFGQPQFNETA